VLPTTTVEFPATSSECTSLDGAEFIGVRHVLQLGVDCGDAIDDPLPEDGTFFFGDVYVECHEGGNFANLDSTGDFGDRYSCGQNQIFLDGDAATPKTVLAFSMTTDSEWLNDAASACYKLGPTTGGTTPTASATVPSKAPVSMPTAPTAVVAPTKPTTTTTANYKVEYTAQFLRIVQDDACEGGPPEIRVMCAGAIKFVNASLPSITCAPLPVDLASDHPNGLRCTVDCASAGDCSEYTSSFLNELRFESVVYECSGDAYDDIDTLLRVTQSDAEPYTCPSDASEPIQFLSGRLGVSCGATTAQRDVSYNFVLFECAGNAISLNENFFSIGEELSCVTGDSCSSNIACDCTSGIACPLDLGELDVVADIYRFPTECVETAAGQTVPEPPSLSPVKPSSTSGVVITSRFQASWSLFADDVILSISCAVDSTVAIVECSQSNITLLEAANSVTCTNSSDSVLRCVDTGATFGGDYASFVEYVRFRNTPRSALRAFPAFLTVRGCVIVPTCTPQECAGAGPGVPATKTRLDPTSATCTDAADSVRIGHAVALGPFCSSVGFVYSDSLFVECQYGNEFYQPEVDEDYRYSCAETVLFDGGATATKDIPTASIMTDQSWQSDYSKDCVQIVKPGDARPPSLAPLTSATNKPVAANTGPAIMGRIPVSPSVGPKSDSTQTTTDTKKAPVGIIVGVSVGAVLFLAIAGAVLFVAMCWTREERNEPQVKEVSEHIREPSQTADYSSPGGGGDDHRYADEDIWMGDNSPAVPASARYAPAAVMPMEVIDDVALTSDRAAAAKLRGSSSSDFPSGDRSASGGQYRNSGSDVVFKDQVQSMIVDGRPMMASDNLFAPGTGKPAAAQSPASNHDFPGRQGEERNAASNSRRYAYQQQDNAVAPVTFNDNTKSMIRPKTVGVPTHHNVVDQEADDGTMTSGITEADTRGSSDPSGIYSHDISVMDPNYDKQSNRSLFHI
jgi:hypothetical protein